MAFGFWSAICTEAAARRHRASTSKRFWVGPSLTACTRRRARGSKQKQRTNHHLKFQRISSISQLVQSTNSADISYPARNGIQKPERKLRRSRNQEIKHVNPFHSGTCSPARTSPCACARRLAARRRP